MKTDFEKNLSDFDSLLKGGCNYLANNAGKVIALITALVAILVTFTDITFQSLGERNFTSGLPVMLFSSYVIYFSLEGSGERLGEKSEEFTKAYDRYNRIKSQIGSDKIEELRRFCYEYSLEEAEYRRKNFLASIGVGEEEYNEYKNGKRLPLIVRRRLKRCDRIKPYKLTPALLLSGEGIRHKSELKNPEYAKFISLLLGLIPTTLGTFFTVSVILTTKESLSAAVIMEGIIKLSALPIIGFKGYSSGYAYVRRDKALWIETKARLLEQFMSKNG